MAANEGMAAFGTKLQMGSGNPVVYTDIAGVTEISGPNVDISTIDITNHNSPGGYAEFVTGIKDGGEVTVDLNYLPETHKPLTDLLDPAVGTTTLSPWRIMFPTGDKWDFSALVTGFEATAPFDDKLTASLTLKISGKPTLTLTI